MPCFLYHQPNTFPGKYLLQTPVVEKSRYEYFLKKHIWENSYSGKLIWEFGVWGFGIREDGYLGKSPVRKAGFG